MNIGLFTSVYFNNIGNGFIDLGAETTINAAKPGHAQIVKLSQCSNFAASLGKKFMLKEQPAVNWLWTHTMQKYAKQAHDRTYQTVESQDVFSILKIVELDYLIVPGCVLTVPFFTIYGDLLKQKRAEGTRIVFLGSSGNYYTEYEIEYVSKQLKALNPFAIMTRDEVAYGNYHELTEHAYNGIDNVFFVNKLGIPHLNTNINPYVVINLEEQKHKEIKERLFHELQREGKTVIFSYHKPFPYDRVIKHSKEKNTMISDYPLDYLHLYNNAEAVYSDRVHACIPTLSFGNAARLYSDSPRSMLFERVGLSDIKNKLCTINSLQSYQDDQIAFLKSLF